MPRIPRLSRGEQDAPPEATAADEATQPQDETQPLTSGDPLATPLPAPPADAETPAPRPFTSGDPLAGGTPGAPAATPPTDAAASADGTPPPAEVPPMHAPTTGDTAAPVEGSASAEAPTVSEPLAPTPPAAIDPSLAEAPTTVVPAVVPVLPGEGVAPEAAPATVEGETVVEEKPADATPRFRERTRMRRRLRELRRLREIAFRDLGGLTFDLHRFGRDRQDLVAEKLQALQQLDAELRELEVALDERRALIELREPGIAACPRCATLHGTDANFCPGCGTPLRGSVVRDAGPLRVTPVDTTPSS